MKFEDQLKLQAYLDGELPERDRAGVETWLSNDPAARNLFEELSLTTAALKGSEVELKVPETREFYWSKIERGIRAEEATAVRMKPASPLDRLVHWISARVLIPAGSIAAVLAVATMAILSAGRESQVMVAADEVSTTDEMGAITFRSEAERMTVVYLFDRSPAGVEDPAPDEPSDP